MVLVLAAGCLCAKNAAAQTGACVVNTQSINIQCQGQNCKGNVTIVEPAGGYGTGVLMATIEVGCCSTKFSTLGNPDGQCSVGAVATPSPVANRLVFLRGCDGRFKLYAVAV